MEKCSQKKKKTNVTMILLNRTLRKLIILVRTNAEIFYKKVMKDDRMILDMDMDARGNMYIYMLWQFIRKLKQTKKKINGDTFSSLDKEKGEPHI